MKKIISIVLIVLLLVGAVCFATACGNKLLKETTLTVKDGILKVANPIVNTVCKAFVNDKEADVDEDTYEIAVPEDAGDKLDVSVEVYDENGKKLGTIKQSFDCLPTVLIEKKDGYYDWTASDAAIKEMYADATVKYYVWLNSEVIEQDAATIEMPAGISTIRVRAFLVGDSTLYSRYSDMMFVNTLATPSTIQYDGTYLTWGPVDFLDMQPKYNVKLTVTPAEGDPVVYGPVEANTHALNIAECEAFRTVFEDKEQMARMDFTVQAVASDETYDSSKYSASKRVSCLDAVTNVHFNDGKVVWDANPYTDTYVVVVEGGVGIDGKQHVVTGTEYALELLSYKQISVRVKPTLADEDAVVFTEWSSAISASYLPMVELQYADGLFYWNSVKGAAGYRFVVEKLDGDKNVTATAFTMDYAATDTSANYNFPEEGYYNVYMVTLAGESTSLTNSIPCTPIEVTRLTAPKTFTLSEDYDKTIDIETQGDGRYSMTIQFQQVGGNDTYYELRMNGTSIASGTKGDAITFMMPAYNKDGYELEVLALASNDSIIESSSDKEHVRRLTLSANSSLKIKLQKLAAPTEVGIDEEGNLTWKDNNVQLSTSQYSVFIDGSELTPTSTNSTPLGNLSAGRYSARIGARGPLSGTDNKGRTYTVGTGAKTDVPEEGIIVSSDLSNLYYLTKLATPESQSIRVLNGGTSLSWAAVEGAVGYTIQMTRHIDTDDKAAPQVITLADVAGNTLIKTNSVDLAGLTYATGSSYTDISLTPYGCTYSIMAVGNHGLDPKTGDALKEGETITMDSNATVSNKFFKLSAPTGLTIQNYDNTSSLVWNNLATSAAQYYEVFDGDIVIARVTGSPYALTTTKEGSHYFNVRAVGDYEEYFPSDRVDLPDADDPNGSSNYNRVVKLPNLSANWQLSGDEYVWEDVTYTVRGTVYTAETYTITLSSNGNTQIVGPDEIVKRADGKYHYRPNFNGYASPVVTVICKGNNVNTIDSDAYTFYQPTRTLAALQAIGSDPLIDFTIINGQVAIVVNAISDGCGFVLSVNKSEHRIPDANGNYFYAIDDTYANGVEIEVTVRDRGEYFDNAGSYVISSAESTPRSFVYLGRVNDNTIKCSGVQIQDGAKVLAFGWTSNAATEYKAYYEVTNAAGDILGFGSRKSFDGSNAYFDLKEIKEIIGEEDGPVNITVYVLAVGNNSDQFSSTKYSSQTFNITQYFEN